jgi:hypothetical protein
MIIKVYDKVIKNEGNWVPNEFDAWGRGVGIGEIISIVGNYGQIRWPNGIHLENLSHLKLMPLKKNHIICPKCKSTDTYETVTIEGCNNCGFFKDYHNWDHNEPDFYYEES